MKENGIVLPERESQKGAIEQPQLVYAQDRLRTIGGIVAWRPPARVSGRTFRTYITPEPNRTRSMSSCLLWMFSFS